MKDYANPSPPWDASPKKKSNRSSKPPFNPLWVVILLLIVAIFFATRYLLDNLENSPDSNTVVNTKDEQPSILPQEAEKEYDFYDTLEAEQAVRINRSEDNASISTQNKRYFVVIEHFFAYETAQLRSEEIRKLTGWDKDLRHQKDNTRIRVEPFTYQRELAFRIRIGPYASRSRMNGMRDELYKENIPNRVELRVPRQ